MKKRATSILLIILCIKLFSQDYRAIDSLYNEYKATKTTYKKVGLVCDIFWHFLYYDNDSAYYYGKLENELVINEHDSLKFLPLYDLGSYYRVVGEYDKSIACFNKILHLNNPELLDKYKANAFYSLGTIKLDVSELDSAIYYFNRSLLYYQKINNIDFISRALINLGSVYYYKGNKKEARLFYDKALEFNEAEGNYYGMAQTLGLLSIMYMDEGDYAKSLIFYKKSIDLHRSQNNHWEASSGIYDIGVIYEKLGDYKMALKHYYEALKIRDSIGATEIGFIYNSIGDVYKIQGDNTKAMDWYRKAYVSSKQNNQTRYVLISLSSIISHNMENGSLDSALYYLNKQERILSVYNEPAFLVTYNIQFGDYWKLKGKLLKAKEHYKKALKQAMILDDVSFLFSSQSKFGEICYLLKDYGNAETYFKKGYKQSKKIGLKLEIADFAHLLSQLYESQGHFQKSLKYFKEYKQYSDSLINEDNVKELTRLEMQYAFDKENREKELEQKRKDEIINAQIEKQHVINASLMVGAFLLVLLVLFVWRGFLIKRKSNKDLQRKNQLIQEQNEEIENQRDLVTKQNEEITSSIVYAERIQQSLLPYNDIVDALLPEHFILFKPRDIVSGDFYWIKPIQDKIIIAAADCTGHGVPGAFMSMLGISFLNEITQQADNLAAAEILNRLRLKIKNTLQQETEGAQKDGMDMALVVLDNKHCSLQYAGAYNPLYLIRNNELITYKADRQPVSVHVKEIDFTNHEVNLHKGDRFYMFSDGFTDQIGGVKQKKYMSKNFKSKLLQIQDKSMAEQKEMLLNEFYCWKSDLEQLDDVLVIGVEV